MNGISKAGRILFVENESEETAAAAEDAGGEEEGGEGENAEVEEILAAAFAPAKWGEQLLKEGAETATKVLG